MVERQHPNHRLGFNPRPRTEGDLGRPAIPPTLQGVSIHAPARRATVPAAPPTNKPLFQSTPPHGGRPPSVRRSGCRWRFQSTPPHGGRPVTDRPVGDSILVSIHAPARRATVCPEHADHLPQVSIHAPARRATPSTSSLASLTTFQSTPPHGGRRDRRSRRIRAHLFQSTPPHGGRPPADGVLAAARSVSIHAPARRATKLVVVL